MLSGSAARLSGTNVGGPLATTRDGVRATGTDTRCQANVPASQHPALQVVLLNPHPYVDLRGHATGIDLDLTRVRGQRDLLAASVPPRAGVQAGGQVEADLGRPGFRVLSSQVRYAIAYRVAIARASSAG